MRTVHAEIRFDGEMNSVKEFYEPLGVKVTELGLQFEKFDLLFVDGDSAVGGIFFSIDIDGDLNEIERYYRRVGVTVLDEGFDASGPYIIVLDPAGLRVRIGLTNAALVNAAKKNPA